MKVKKSEKKKFTLWHLFSIGVIDLIEKIIFAIYVYPQKRIFSALEASKVQDSAKNERKKKYPDMGYGGLKRTGMKRGSFLIIRSTRQSEYFSIYGS